MTIYPGQNPVEPDTPSQGVPIHTPPTHEHPKPHRDDDISEYEEDEGEGSDAEPWWMEGSGGCN